MIHYLALLFILGLEILASSIRQNEKIQGILIRNVEVKVSLFADDLSCFLRNIASYDFLKENLEQFSKCSGLKVNEEKTEFFLLGTNKFEEELSPHEFQSSIKILGVHFDYNDVTRRKANFDSILKSIKKSAEHVEVEGSNSLRKNTNGKVICNPQNYVQASFDFGASIGQSAAPVSQRSGFESQQA